MHSLILDRFSCKTLFTITSITIGMFRFFLHTKVVHIHVSVTRRWPIENSLVITYISLCRVAHNFLNDNFQINFWGLLKLMFIISSMWVFSCYKQLTKKQWCESLVLIIKLVKNGSLLKDCTFLLLVVTNLIGEIPFRGNLRQTIWENS